MVIPSKLLPILLLYSLWQVSASENFNCLLLNGHSKSISDFMDTCGQKEKWRSLQSFRLDISSSSTQQVNELFSRVSKMTNIVIVASLSTLESISFPAMKEVENFQFELWSNHELRTVQFPVLDRNISTFGRMNIVGNKVLNQETIDFFSNAPRDLNAKTDQIQDFGECYHGGNGLGEYYGGVKPVNSFNWRTFKNCRYHSGDLKFAPSLLDFHTAQFGEMFKNVTGCVIVADTQLSNVNFLGVSNRFCDDAKAEGGIFRNSRLCLTEQQETDFGSRQSGNRDSTCRSHCNQAENGTLVSTRGSSLPCKVLEGNLIIGPESKGVNNYFEIEYIEGSLKIVGSDLTSLRMPNLLSIGSGCHDSLEIGDNAKLSHLDLSSFAANGAIAPSMDNCKHKVVIKDNGYRIRDTEKATWVTNFPNADVDIDFVATNVDESWNTNWLFLLLPFGIALYMYLNSLAFNYWDNCRKLYIAVAPKFLVQWKEGKGSDRAKEQLRSWAKEIIVDSFFGWRHVSYQMDNHYHCSRQTAVNRLNEADADALVKRFDNLTNKYKEVIEELPPISVLPNPLNAPTTGEGEFRDRFDMYAEIVVQEEDMIVIMDNDEFVREESKKALTRLPFRRKDESRKALPREIKRVVKDSDGNSILHPKHKVPWKESISFKYMGVQPTEDYRKCRKVEVYVEAKLWDHKKSKMDYINRRMYVVHWATWGYDSLPTSRWNIAHLLNLKKNLWNHSMRLYVFSGMAHQFHINFQMLLWTILSVSNNVCKDIIPLQDVVDLAVAISTGNDGGFNLNMLCYTMHSMINLVFSNNLISKKDPKYFMIGDWLAIANRADPIIRFLRTGALFLEDVSMAPHLLDSLTSHPLSGHILTFGTHAKSRRGIPAALWPMNFWIAFGRFPLTVLPVKKFPRVAFLDQNRDYSVKWEPLRSILKRARHLTREEIEQIRKFSHPPLAIKGPAANAPKITPVNDDAQLIEDNKNEEEKKAVELAAAADRQKKAVELAAAADRQKKAEYMNKRNQVTVIDMEPAHVQAKESTNKKPMGPTSVNVVDKTQRE